MAKDKGDLDKLRLSEAEWKKKLSAEQYKVLRQKGTESAFNNTFWDCKLEGEYHCAACGLPLFDSEAKYDSGTGWPSYWEPITPLSVEYEEDNSLGSSRVEVICAKCASHLGHVFKDGPKPTGLRYCMNSTALKFTPKKGKQDVMFKDRIDAGEQLALKLKSFKNKENTFVIGLPRGGVPVAYEVARYLNLPLDIVSPRKIGAPMNKEFAIGAITESGQGIFDDNLIAQLGIPRHYIESEVAQEKKIARRRLDSYRKGMPPRDVKGKTVILVDDGLATGSTMKAAIKTMKAEGAVSIVVAVPVSPPDTVSKIEQEADEVICLSAPLFFQAVGQFYKDFTPTEDYEVEELLKLAQGNTNT